MATLTDADYTSIKKIIGRQTYNDIFKVLSLNKGTMELLFQQMEDYFTTAFLAQPTTSIKAALATVYPSITNAEVKAVIDVWSIWRVNYL